MLQACNFFSLAFCSPRLVFSNRRAPVRQRLDFRRFVQTVAEAPIQGPSRISAPTASQLETKSQDS